MEERTDEEIIRSVLSGRVHDFQLLVERHMKLAYRTAFSVVQNHEDAQEVVQDAFLKAFTNLASFHGKSKFSTWLFRIVYHTSLNHLEKSKSYQKNILLGDIENTDDYNIGDSWNHLITKDRVKYIEDALNLLIAEDRLALSLFYLDEKSQHEISSITGWSLSSTKMRIHRARSKLNKALQQILDTEKNSLI